MLNSFRRNCVFVSNMNTMYIGINKYCTYVYKCTNKIIFLFKHDGYVYIKPESTLHKRESK